jgi:hypothetical protein
MTKKNHHSSTNPWISLFARILIYGVLMVLLSQFTMWDAAAEVPMKFSENTFTEWAQQSILFIMAILFGVVAWKHVSFRALSIVLMGISLIGLVREYNNFFNNQVFDGAWQVTALLVLIMVLVLFYPYRRQLVANLKTYQGSISQGFLLAGFLSTFIYSRLFGRTVFWEALMEQNYLQNAKNAAEEGTELLGYSLLLIASIEYFMRYQKPLNQNGKSERSV